jgi:hypothetical protein
MELSAALWIDLPTDSGEAKVDIAQFLEGAAEFCPVACPDGVSRVLMDVFEVRVQYDERAVGVRLGMRQKALRDLSVRMLDETSPIPNWPNMPALLSLWKRLGVKNFWLEKAEQKRAAILDELWPLVGRNLGLEGLKKLHELVPGSRLVGMEAASA